MRPKAVVQLLAQTALAYLALFTAWGWDDLPGFFAHPARAGVVAVMVGSLLAIFVFQIDLQMFRRGTRPVGRQRWVLALLFTVSLSLLLFLPYGDRRGLLTFAGGDFLRYLGVGLYAAGNVFAFLAVRALGKQYSGYVTLQENHQLVQHGIYSVIRHPIYLRILLVTLSVPLVFGSWLALPMLLLGALFVAYRIRAEERLLAEHFGVEFEAYARRTWRLVPYLY
ncbi:MAG: methyltransferase family protein [Candidatus Acidiferrales bacterium]